jgi:hypothetical protein
MCRSARGRGPAGGALFLRGNAQQVERSALWSAWLGAIAMLAGATGWGLVLAALGE